MKLKRIIAIACTAAMTVSLISGCGGASDKGQKEAVKEAEGTAKEDLPLAKYPETVTVHLGGKMNPNAKIPKGMSFEDNSYTRLLKENLNIQVVYDWTASTSDYDEKMSLCIGSNTIPEIMNVNATQYRALLKYDMIQPLDKYFDDYASDALKSYVKSGGEELQKCITNEDGELMAIPAPNLTAGGVNEMWIRQDWLDALGLDVPRTWDELAEVAKAFVTRDPDGNGENDTIGILGPGVHFSDLLAYLFELMICFLLALCVEISSAVVVLCNPVACELAFLYFGKHFLHFGFHVICDKTFADFVIAVFRGIGNGITHRVEAALVNKVDDEFHFVNALEVCVTGIVTRFDKRFETCFHKRGNAAAKHALFAEQVGFGFALERGFEHARTRSADTCRISKRDIESFTRVVLMNGNEARHAFTVAIFAANGMSGTLRRDHEYIHVCGRNDLLEVNIETVSKRKRFAFGKVRLDVLLI